jgi:hypothetical protein
VATMVRAFVRDSPERWHDCHRKQHKTRESLYEAAALGLKPLRDAERVDTLGPMTRLQLQVRAPTVRHEVTIQQLQRWLDGAPISPHEAVRKATLKSILK